MSGGSSALPQQQQQNVTVHFSDEAVAKIIKAYRDHNEEQDDHLRGYMLVLATLTASITYTAGLTPPGGFWGADDKAKGHVAGTPIFRDIFINRYLCFYYFNVTSFASSLCIIVFVANRKLSNMIKPALFSLLVVDITGLALAFTAGSTTTAWANIITIVLMFVVLALIYVRLLLLRVRIPVREELGLEISVGNTISRQL